MDIPRFCETSGPDSYSVLLIGDTHYDTEPAEVYHSHYHERTEWLNKVQRAEFARNGEMWRDRCPRLMQRAARLIAPDTQLAIQMGDLIQGDCGKGEVHRQMLDDVMNHFKTLLGGLPLVTVAGNHDIRGTDALSTYHDYMPPRMSQELGLDIRKTTFSFRIGPDVYIVIDFNNPDDGEVEQLLAGSTDARYTFLVVHGTIFPRDAADARWFYHGARDDHNTACRRHFRRLFAQRDAVCLCGHTHTTEYYDWLGDGGRITQMTLNSVWAKPRQGQWAPDATDPAQYGTLRQGKKLANGRTPADETALFDEYRPGLRHWEHANAAGSYMLRVSPKHITLDMWAGDSEDLSKRFLLR